jgi:hypothetical protein
MAGDATAHLAHMTGTTASTGEEQCWYERKQHNRQYACSRQLLQLLGSIDLMSNWFDCVRSATQVRLVQPHDAHRQLQLLGSVDLF